MTVIGAAHLSTISQQARFSLIPLLAGRKTKSLRCSAMPAMATAEVKLSQDELKQQAAWKAVEYVKSGMKLGLGTGSTAAFAVDKIGQLLKDGTLKDIVGVPTSIRTYEQALSAHSSTLWKCFRHLIWDQRKRQIALNRALLMHQIDVLTICMLNLFL